jgi:hypothetical protein
LIHGKKAKIRPDTREHKRTTGVMDEIWVSRLNYAVMFHTCSSRAGVI